MVYKKDKILKELIGLNREPKSVIVNEQQYSDIILCEEMHYPRFLDAVKLKVSNICIDLIKGMIENHVSKQVFDRYIDNRLYFNHLSIDISLHYGGNMHDSYMYSGACESGEKLDELNYLLGCKLYLSIPVSQNGEINPGFILGTVSHEVTHLYDDWNSLMNGGPGIFNNKKEEINNDAVNDVLVYGSDKFSNIIQSLVYMLYLSINSERKAFVSQLYQELESCGTDYSNYREKLKECACYINVTDGRGNFLEDLKYADAEELENVNKWALENYKGNSIPKMNASGFDAEAYRNKLHRWCDKIINGILHRYAGVVQCYLNDRQKEYMAYGGKNVVPIFRK